MTTGGLEFRRILLELRFGEVKEDGGGDGNDEFGKVGGGGTTGEPGNGEGGGIEGIDDCPENDMGGGGGGRSIGGGGGTVYFAAEES